MKNNFLKKGLAGDGGEKNKEWLMVRGELNVFPGSDVVITCAARP